MAPKLKTQYHHYIPQFILKTFDDNFSLNVPDKFASTPGLFMATPMPDDTVQSSGRKEGKDELPDKEGKDEGPDKEFALPGANEQGEGEEVQEEGQVADLEVKEQRQVVDIEVQEEGQVADIDVKEERQVYQAASRTVSLNSVRRSYGVQNLYRDVSEKNLMKFEELLSKMESTSSRFIRKIWTGEEDLSLTRTQLGELKKFLAIMTYRSNNRRGQYYNNDFSASTRQSILMHMRHKNIKRIQDVWFDNLKWIINTAIDDIMEEYEKFLWHRADMMMTPRMDEYQGPIHIAELSEFANMCTNLMCIWQAEEGSEFILSEGCFGAWEGDSRDPFHTFYIVSPRYAIVLVNRLRPWDLATQLPFRSWFEGDIHPNPETVYTKGPPPSNFTPDHFSPTDVFKYKRVVVPKEDVYFVNSIFLDARRECLTYKSNLSMYRSIQYYDKMKRYRPDLFNNGHDYTLLKRKLVADMVTN
ncbi:hypothetical protein BGZ47_010931 [Haplosporangium gracile]|nr:hypothetical protein BGZ47_010931 [Haplosporangium gracile]